MTATPAISVVVQAWNSGTFLDTAIDSLLAQNWRDFELIVIDDASTDDTGARIEAWARRDDRIRVVTNGRNLGFPASLALGLELARAPWYARMDGDDWSAPTRLEKQLAAARRTPGTVMVSCPHDVIRTDGRIERGRIGQERWPGLLSWFLLFYARIGGGGQMLFSTEALRRTGGFSDANIAADYGAWVRLSRVAPPVVIPEPLYAWREHNPRSQTRARSFRHTEPSLEVSRAALREHSGLELDRAAVVALRDFWTRFPASETDWDAVQRHLSRARTGYHLPYPIAGFEARARRAVAEGWLALAARTLRQGDARTRRGHLRRAREAAGGRWPVVLAGFLLAAARVRGRLDLLS